MSGADGPGHSPADLPDELHDLLAEARQAGFLGSGPLDVQLGHAMGFAVLARRLASDAFEALDLPATPGTPCPRPRIVDLGSGGGLPGLVVAAAWPEVVVLLLDANARRTDFLRRAVDRLGLGERVSVVQERAEHYGRLEGVRGGFEGVLARSFGRPAVVAECAAPLLHPGGWLVVSEPPPDRPGASPTQDRWPADSLFQLGLVPQGTVREGFDYQILRQVDNCPERFPRRDGVPAKKPLF